MDKKFLIIVAIISLFYAILIEGTSYAGDTRGIKLPAIQKIATGGDNGVGESVMSGGDNGVGELTMQNKKARGQKETRLRNKALDPGLGP